MSEFTDFEAFRYVEGTRKTYELCEPLRWEIGKKNSGLWIKIEAGTHFDISVPRLLEWALNPHDRAVLLAATVHDELLRLGFDPAFASAEFRRAAKARGCSRAWGWVLFTTTLVWTAIH